MIGFCTIIVPFFAFLSVCETMELSLTNLIYCSLFIKVYCSLGFDGVIYVFLISYKFWTDCSLFLKVDYSFCLFILENWFDDDEKEDRFCFLSSFLVKLTAEFFN